MTGRLPSCTASQVAKALERAGFVPVHQKGSHRYFADPISSDILTTVPMHPGDISRSLLKKIIKDVGLTDQEFRRFGGTGRVAPALPVRSARFRA